MKPNILVNEAGLLHRAAELAQTITAPAIIFLSGDLGAGKTTFTRGLLQVWGYTGNVKSPTFTLVETYDLPQFTVHHFDLYRIDNPEELELLGIRDYFDDHTITIFEWPEKAKGLLPLPTLTINIEIIGEQRQITVKHAKAN